MSQINYAAMSVLRIEAILSPTSARQNGTSGISG